MPDFKGLLQKQLKNNKSLHTQTHTHTTFLNQESLVAQASLELTL